MTTEQLYEIIRIQQDEINQLRDDLKYLKDWSDLNDYWLREMIDTLTDTVDGIMDDHCCCEKYKTSHEERKNRKKEENTGLVE
jgi:hypothetical protein